MNIFDLASYEFELPPGQIAQFPAPERGLSRLMILDRNGIGQPGHARFNDLVSYLPPGALLVANNSRVVHARLVGKRPGGGNAEFLLLTPLPLIAAQEQTAVVDGLIRPAAKIHSGQKLNFDGMTLEIRDKSEYGQCSGYLSWQGDLETALLRAGRLPLPPYIKREPEREDEKRYQTVYASRPGSIAAPTAGLHFTQDLRARLSAAGHDWEEISLHVGYGTFSPVRAADIRHHKMHEEYVEIGEAAANAVARAKAEGRPVIAVGTTSARALEGCAVTNGEISPFSGMVNIFIYPGYEFNVIDGLITNFHLPGSSLLMLVSALAGRERVLDAYAKAVQNGYRFFSYGDAMLIR